VRSLTDGLQIPKNFNLPWQVGGLNTVKNIARNTINNVRQLVFLGPFTLLQVWRLVKDWLISGAKRTIKFAVKMVHFIDFLVPVALLVASYCYFVFRGMEWIISLLVERSSSELSKMLLQLILANGKRSGRSPDTILADAISIGGLKLTAPFSWTIDSSSASSSSSIDRSTRTASGGPSQSSWQEAKARKDEFVKKDLLSTVKPSTTGPPVLPFLLTLTRYETIRRCLAFREFSVVATEKSSSRRKQLLARGKGQWPQVVYSSLGMIDAITLQLQLIVAYGVAEILNPEGGRKSGSGAVAGGSGSGSGSSGAGLTYRIRSVLEATKTSEAGAISLHWGGDISWDAMDVVKRGREGRKKGQIGSVLMSMLPAALVKSKAALSVGTKAAAVTALLPPAVGRWLDGVRGVEADPLSPVLVRSATFAVDGLSHMLISALADDSCGFAQHHLPAALESLCALQIALQDHRDLLRRCHPIGAVHNVVYGPFLIDKKTLKNAPKNGQKGRHVSDPRVQRARLQVSPNLELLEAAVDQAIARLVRAYRDLLDSYMPSFPRLHVALLKNKLAAIAQA
jgi:hypothetical protein